MSIDFPNGLGEIVYEMDYYAGSQVLVYAEHVLIDDCVRIGWSVQQNRQPIWGYASQYYNALAAGTVIVNGSFWIAFKEAYYMTAILNEAIRGRNFGEDGEFFSTPALGPRSGSDFSSSLAGSSSAWEGTNQEGGARTAGTVSRANIERLTAAAERDDQNLEITRSFGNLLTALGAMDDREFEDNAERFEDAIWYGGNRPREGRGDAMSGNISGATEMSEENLLAFRRADQFPPFDLLVTYGDINNSAANHTVHRLCDVSIVNTENGGIEPTGEPVIVRLDFIARNAM